MSQSSALPAWYSAARGRIYSDSEQPAHSGNMVADMLTLIALAAAPTAETGSRASVEVRVTATIQRGVTLQNGRAVAPTEQVSPVRRKPRACGPVDKIPTGPMPDCRLIVYDLP
jgi:inosine-uridine nucleoside N-ribohydrolase